MTAFGSAVDRVWMHCRRGDHHRCVVMLEDFGKCPCPCHTRDAEERKARTG